jgi:internalin A
MAVGIAGSTSVCGWVWRRPGAAIWLVLLLSGLSQAARADDQVVSGPRGSLTARPAGDRLQIVEWIGPGATALAWPKIDPRHYSILSLRAVPTGLPQIGMVAALTPTWGLNLCGVPISDGDLKFVVKRCHSLAILRLRHPATLLADELDDLSADERVALNARTLSGDGLAQIERLKRLLFLEIRGYELPPTRLQFLSELKELRSLSLTEMKITDDDLQALSGLPHLTRLDLSRTAVTGKGLGFLHDCPELNCVTLNGSPVTDELVKILQEHPLAKLQQLHVHGCKLTQRGIADLRHAVPLFATVIAADYGPLRLTSVIPPAPRDAQAIRSYRAACDLLSALDLGSMSVVNQTVVGLQIDPRGWTPSGDWVLAGLPMFQGLKNLRLAGCRFSADGLAQLPELDQLEYLDLSKSTVDDAGIEPISRLNRLRALNLSQTKLTDAAMESLSRLPNLERLYVGGTQVTDRGLRAIRFQMRLKILDLAGCHITDEGAQALATNKSLEYVRCDNTRLTDRGLRALANLPQLKGLSCVNCRITDDGAEKLLRVENLAYCRLDGTSTTKIVRLLLDDHIAGVRASLRTQSRWGQPPGRVAAPSTESDSSNLDDTETSTAGPGR